MARKIKTVTSTTTESKRINRTAEQIVAELQAKIEGVKARAAAQQAKAAAGEGAARRSQGARQGNRGLHRRRKAQRRVGAVSAGGADDCDGDPGAAVAERAAAEGRGGVDQQPCSHRPYSRPRNRPATSCAGSEVLSSCYAAIFGPRLPDHLEAVTPRTIDVRVLSVALEA